MNTALKVFLGASVGVIIGVFIILFFNNLQNQDNQGTGGAETEVIQRMNVDHEVPYLFPIHPDDFLFYSSPFGVRVSPILNRTMHHNGIDIGATWRAQIVAVADGVITEHWPPPDGYFKGHRIYGGMVKIEHDDGSLSLYAHMSWTNRSVVRQGNRIKAGQVIGRVGDTGMSRGNHLHFELHINGRPVNPLLYVQSPEELEEGA